jgi:hypothetical protein
VGSEGTSVGFGFADGAAVGVDAGAHAPNTNDSNTKPMATDKNLLLILISSPLAFEFSEHALRSHASHCSKSESQIQGFLAVLSLFI